jgi:hypothetical protein
MQVLPVSGTSMRTLSVGGTATNFIVANLNANTSHVYWTLAGADIRLTIDGSTPTTTIGHVFKDGNSGIWSAGWAKNAKVIAVSGTGIFTISELNYI